MQIIPVLDLKQGLVVRGVGGRREEYRAVRSRLVDSADPVAVAAAFRDRLGLDLLYVADLDAIAGTGPALATFRELVESGFELMVDAGLRGADAVKPLLDCGVQSVIVGLETASGPALLAELARSVSASSIWFSLDLRHGKPITQAAEWSSATPLQIAAQAIACGMQQLIVLDLAAVGEARGVPTLELCRRLTRSHPAVKVVAGGGVRGVADLHELESAGVWGALVASALHDGRIGRDWRIRD